MISDAAGILFWFNSYGQHDLDEASAPHSGGLERFYFP